MRKILVAAAVATVSFAPSAVSGEFEWNGYWTAPDETEQCEALKPDSPPTDSIPLQIEVAPKGNGQDYGYIAGYEWGCRITKITKIRELDAAIFDLDCGVEGIEYKERRVFMANDKNSVTVYGPTNGVNSYGLAIREADRGETWDLRRCTKN